MGMSNQLVPHFWRLLLSRGALKYFISDFAKIMKKQNTRTCWNRSILDENVIICQFLMS